MTVKPFQIRGRFLTAVALRPEGNAPDETFFAALDEQLRDTPQFFADAPLILDLEQAGGLSDPEEMRAFVAALKGRKLSAFGVQNASPQQLTAALEAGLIQVIGGRDTPPRAERSRVETAAPAKAEPQSEASAEASAQAHPERAPRRADRLLPPDNLVITSPVRSGQMVVAERGDLVIVGSVASGAELVAAGNIHVYGRLRGRALAGVHGDESARIFCQSLDAELLAIAGLYRTSDNLEDALRNRYVQVFLDDERLCVEALG